MPSTPSVLCTVQFPLLLSQTVQYRSWFATIRSYASRCAARAAVVCVRTIIPAATFVPQARPTEPLISTAQVSHV